MTETMAIVAIREAVEELKFKGLKTRESYSAQDGDIFAIVWVSVEGCPMSDETSSCFMCTRIKDTDEFVKMLNNLARTVYEQSL
jgi:uncharacterized protein (DUF2141 family)